ncbi:MAG: hypothetical protein JXC85_05170 [Candidatus Aenigmarchaeota archaeon]|nr:hypothetical protein [Candidatus Aenigmarchaeota archaeon]
MHKQKGITPIIAILVILLITIAITGSAWIYISTYYSGMTSEAIEITSVDCTGSGATIYIHNIGTDTISTNNIAISREVVTGDCVNSSGGVTTALAASWGGATEVSPGGTLIFKDTNCVRSVNASVASYTVISGGRVQKLQISC